MGEPTNQEFTTFPGGLELILEEFVVFGVLHNVWPSWIEVAANFNPKLGGLGH